MSSPRRILLVRLSHLGDVCHALPVFHALRCAEPGAEIAWAVQPEFAPLIEKLPGLDQLFLFDRHGGFGAWRELRRELREWSPDWAIDAQGNWKSAGVCRVSGAKKRSGMHKADWTEPSAAWLVPDRAERATFEEREVPHAVDRMLALCRHVAPGVPVDAPQFDLAPTGEEMEHAEVAWVRHVDAESCTILMLGPKDDPRSWPLEHFADLARDESERGRTVLCLSGPGEREAGEELARTLQTRRRVSHWVGQKGLRELAAFFCVAAKRDARLVARDGGPLHLAVACGVKTLCLEGPQDARRTGGWPPSEDGSVGSGNPPACMPCLARRCGHVEGPVCMSGLEVVRVAAALARSRGEVYVPRVVEPLVKVEPLG